MKPIFRYRPIRLVIFLVALIMLAAACSPSGTEGQPTAPPKETQPAPVEAAPSEFPTPFENQIPVPPAAQAAQELLAKRLNLPVDQVTISEIEQVQWSDACLGLQKPDEACLAVITDGFQVMLTARGKAYEAHTDMEGTQVRFAEDFGKGLPQGVTPQPGGDAEDLEEKVRQALAKKAGIAIDQIKVVSVEPVEWPDGCLGVRAHGVSCIQVITPGYRVMLEANGETFEFHTDELGNTILQAGSPSGETTDATLAWEQTEDGACSQVEVNGSSVKAGPCGGAARETTLSPDRMKELAYFGATFEPFKSETESGNVDFVGSGVQVAVEAEQRSLAEWARLVYQEARAGSSAASVGALIWHREGGIAGFCNDLNVYLSGWAEPSTCKGGQVKSQTAYRLTAGELEKLYAWVDRFENFEYEQTDPATADAMTVKLVFLGSGMQQASAAQQEEIVAFAASLYTAAARQQ